MDPRLVLIGLLVGLLIGVSGVGGSSLMTPLLIMALRVNPLVAVGTDLAYSVPTKVLGAVVHWRQKTIDRRVVACLCLGGIPGAVVGLIALVQLGATLGTTTLNDVIKHSIGVLLVIAAVALVFGPLLSRLSARFAHIGAEEPDGPLSEVGKGRLIALGVIVGFLVSLTSIGSGSLTVPILYILLPRLGLRRLIGSDVVFAACLAPVAAFGHAVLGSVDFGISANLLLGSLPGVLIGSKLLARLPSTLLRPALAGVLLWAGGTLVGIA